MKAIKTMQSTQISQLKEKIGTTFVNELEYLTQLSVNASLNIEQQGAQIMNTLHQYLK